MKYVLLTMSALVLAACASVEPEPICDREAIEWDKWGSPTELPTECLPNTTTAPAVSTPDGPDTPDNPDGPKGDNSDANGKGGNSHDRDDFTHGGTEVAEDKKDGGPSAGGGSAKNNGKSGDAPGRNK